MRKAKHLAAMPLGGVGEIGMNMMVYECDGDYIVVDAGVSFGDHTTPGVDTLIPETKFLRDHKNDIAAVFITHAHEDHIGAIAYCWDDFAGAPVYATPFACKAIEHKLKELGVRPGKNQLRPVNPRENYKAGLFTVEFVPVCHSIPEATALAITTHYGTIVHTGDYRFDDHAPLNQPVDEKRLAEIGNRGVLAAFGESTNIMSLKESISEGEVAEHLNKIIAGTKGRIFFAAFASHVGRGLKVAEIAAANGRRICFLGHSINKMIGYAKELGYFNPALKGVLVESEEAKRVPADKLLVFVSGTQGQPTAGLTRLSQGQEVRGFKLGKDDTVIISSRMIPGNERAILDVISGLYAHGATVYSELNDRAIHTSGHGNRPDIERMYKLIKPEYVVPVHGEPYQLIEHANVAKSWGYKPLQLKLGHKLVIAPGEPHLQDHAYAHGYNYIDGLNILGHDTQLIKDRLKLSYDGVVSAAIVVRRSNGEWLGSISLATKGLLDERRQGKLLANAARMAEKTLEAVFPDAIIDDTVQAAEAVSQSLRKSFKQERGKTPTVMVQIVEV